jgi:hypothetical protein
MTTAMASATMIDARGIVQAFDGSRPHLCQKTEELISRKRFNPSKPKGARTVKHHRSQHWKKNIFTKRCALKARVFTNRTHGRVREGMN